MFRKQAAYIICDTVWFTKKDKLLPLAKTSLLFKTGAKQ